jgi:VWFA-related protein
MRDMRRLLIAAAMVVTAATLNARPQSPQPPSTQAPSLKPQAPPPQQPVFRAGIELLTVDVTAIDGNGRQITDLTAADFQVEVDGDRRQVVSAEYVRLADPLRAIAGPAKVNVPDETYSSSNTKGAPSGRLIVVLVDQGNIRTGAGRQVMNSAKKFVDTLAPEDRVAVIAIPGPGEHVDFTTNHDRVRESLLRIVGQAEQIKSRFNISLTEALALYMRSDQVRATEVILRECGQTIAGDTERCEREVYQDAAEMVGEMRRRTQDSVDGMRAVFKSIGALEGPKSIILVTEGLVFEGLGTETEELAQLAADSRASLDVLLLDVSQFDVTVGSLPTTPREDRDLREGGIEQLAGATRGQLYRINVAADFAFDRISRALDGHYLLGVESKPDDRNGRRHRLSVRSAKKGVSIRSRRTFLTSLSAKAGSPAEAVERALRSPLPINDLPLRVSSWTYKEPGTNRVRVLAAVEIERLAEQSLEYTTGMALVNRQGRGVAPQPVKQTLKEKVGEPGTAIYSSMIAVEPGEYRLIVSVADSEGRIGSVTRAVTAWQMDGAAVAMGDLVVGTVAAGATIEPVIEPVINGGQMAALLEAYGPPGSAIEAMLEILVDENSSPLATVPMRVVAGSSPEVSSASAQFSTTALPPGRYLARGTIRQGGKPQGHITRPFRIVAEAAMTDGVAAPSTGGALPVDMIKVMLGSLAKFDRKEVLAPSALTPILAAAESRPTGSKAAIKEARGGDLGGAAMTALAEGDQVLAMFLKGLEFYQKADLDRAAMQFQNSMQLAPTFAPSRLFLGATLAEGERHKEAAGLLQSAATGSANATLARIAGEEWLKAGQPQLAITPLELAVQSPSADARARKLLGVAYVLGGRPADAVAAFTPYLDANPTDQAALLGALFGTYIRHLNAPQPATLAADRANMAKWAKAYAATKGPVQPLVSAWSKHVQGLK